MDREYIAGEFVPGDGAARLLMEELDRLLAGGGWQTCIKKKNLLVEYKAVAGPFEKSGVYVTRAQWTVKADAKKLFSFLTGPAGYRVIDPACDPNDHTRAPLEVYSRPAGVRADAACAGISVPVLPRREFVVMNVADGNRLAFMSKSILHPSKPGGSIYSSVAVAENPVRALNTFGYRITPAGEGLCTIRSVNYMDLCAGTPAKLNNFINMKVFYPLLKSRLEKAVKKNRL